MGGRFTEWYRNAGDVNASPALRDLAKKLLGYLENQRKLGAPPTLVVRRANRDGMVEAAFIDGMPRVRIVAHGPAKAPNEPGPPLEGFVVTPGGPHGVGSFPEVVLQPKKGADVWHVSFYDETTVPMDYPAKHSIYKPTFPDGLIYAGQVDWRSTDEKLSVCWDGPRTRYFSDGSAGSSLVYFKNAVVFDAAPVMGALGLGSDTVEVRGACLTSSGMRLLVVVLRTLGGVSYDSVLSVPLGMSPPTKPPGLTPRMHANVLHPADSIEVLLDRALPGDENDIAHPWFFNQAGTEARCMRPDGNTTMHELVLGVDPTTGEWTVTRNSEAWPTVTTADSVSRTLRALRIEGTYNAERVASGGTVVESLSGAMSAYRGAGVNTPSDEEYELDYIVAQTRTTTVSGSGALRIAVDYRDGAPVYAFALPPDTTESYSFSSSRSGSYSDSVTATTGTGLSLTAVATSGAHDEISSDSSTTTRSGRTAGIQTDWGTFTATVSASASTAHDYAWHDTWSNSATLTSPQAAPWGLWGTDFRGFSSASTQTTSQDNSSTTTETGLLNLHHLDLRYRWLSYLWYDTVTTTADTGGTSYAVNGSALDSATATATTSGAWAGPFSDAAFVGTTLAISYGAYNNTPASMSDTGVTTCSSTKSSSYDRTEDYRLRVTLGGLLVQETTIHTATTSSDTPNANVIPFRRYGDVLRAATDGNTRRDGRTPTDLMGISPSTDFPDTVGSGSSTVAQDDFTQALALDEGCWQTYGDHYCWAVKADPLGTGAVYAHGVGLYTALAVTPSAFTLPTLTGYAGTPERFCPVSILPPTARPTH